VEGKIVDISGDGVGLELPVGLPFEATIAIESESNIALGLVRYHREISPERFRVGAQLHHIIGKDDLANDTTGSGFISKLGARFGCRGKAIDRQ